MTARTYEFTVREVTERTAFVAAGSERQARAMLKHWATPKGGELASEFGPIVLGDLESVRVTIHKSLSQAPR